VALKSLDIYWISTPKSLSTFTLRKGEKVGDEKCHFFRNAHKTIFYQKYTLKKNIKLFVTLLSGFILLGPLAKKSDPVCINLLSHL
jgi:hypothetical protein